MFLQQRTLLFIVAVLWLNTSTVLASDHIDGVINTKYGITDIGDLYAFPSPPKEGHLIVVMTVYPLAPRDAHFVERMQYNIILRQLSTQGTGLATRFNSNNESRISCTFMTKVNKTDEITCRISNKFKDITVSNDVDNVSHDKLGNEVLTVFAGRRADPFFVDSNWLEEAQKGVLLPPTDRKNVFIGMNTLGLVLDIDLKKLYPSQTVGLMAVSGETLTQDDIKAPWRRLDRIGRAEMTNVTVAPNGGPMIQQYNAEDSFNVSPKNREIYHQAMLHNIRHYDQLDGKKDWQDDAIAALVNILLDDFLILDMTKPCHFGKEYMAIETALLAGKKYHSCGGRHFKDDIIDRILSSYVNAENGVIVGDGIDQPATILSNAFPYLTEPENGTITAIKTAVVRWMIQHFRY